jgi:hypothetical protein
MKFILGALFLCAFTEAWDLKKTVEKKPKYRPDAKRFAFTYGPFELLGKDERKAAGSMDKKGQTHAGMITQGINEKQVTFLSAHLRLKHENGSLAEAPGVYIHHILVSPVGDSKPMPIVRDPPTGLSTPSGFIDRGEDSGEVETVFTSKDGKFNGGYHASNGMRFLITSDLVNYSNVKKTLYFEVEVEYVKGKVGIDVGHTLKSVTSKDTSRG